MTGNISKLAVSSRQQPPQVSFNRGTAPRQSTLRHWTCVQDVWLLTLMHRMSFLLSVCVSPTLAVFIPWQKITKTTKKCPEQPNPLHLHIRESCCDKLCRWLNTAIRQHTVCLTKCFLSDTLELSWLLAARFWVFIWAPLWGSVSISGGFGFLSPLRPLRRGHMVRRCWRGCCSWITYSPWWSHVGSQWWSTPLSSIYQTEAILCHVLTYLLTCFIWEQMLVWRRCRWKSLLSKFSY